MAQPDKLAPADRMAAVRKAARSLALLLEAIEGKELVATPRENIRLRGAVEALEAMLGESAEGQ